MRGIEYKGKTKSVAWPLLDYARWVFALCVVMIHVISIYKCCPPPLFEFVVNQSVPFFFIASGFLVGVKVDALSESKERQKAIIAKG